MELLKWTISIGLVACTGVVAGAGWSIRRVLLIWYHLIILISTVFVVIYLTTQLGSWLGDSISIKVMDVLVGLGLIGIGLFIASRPPIYPGGRDLLLFSAALLLEAGGLGLSYGMENGSGGLLALFVSLCVAGGLIGGWRLGGMHWPHWRIKYFAPYLPCAALIVIGLIRIV